MGSSEGKTYLNYLQEIANEDVTRLLEKEKNYGDSWKKRGGVGAFMMLARKWDRIEQQVQRRFSGHEASVQRDNAQWDIFVHLNDDLRHDGLLDDIRDLRCYLLLVEAEMRALHG